MEKFTVTLQLDKEQLRLLNLVLRHNLNQYAKENQVSAGTEWYRTTLANLQRISNQVRSEFLKNGGREWNQRPTPQVMVDTW